MTARLWAGHVPPVHPHHHRQNMTTLPFETGDTLGAIAHQQLGDVTQWREIATQNGINIFDQIPIGTELQIPTVADLERMAKERIGESLQGIDLSSVARGRFGFDGSVNQAIKLVDFLY